MKEQEAIIEKPKLEVVIYKVIKNICPAFWFDDTIPEGGGALWHRCRCHIHGNCICVWHETDTCPERTWEAITKIALPLQNQKAQRKQLWKDCVKEADG